MVAEALAEQADRDGVDIPVMPDAAARDRLVLVLVDALGGGERGVPGMMMAPVRGLALRLATARAQRRRGALTDATYAAAGDICSTRRAVTASVLSSPTTSPRRPSLSS